MIDKTKRNMIETCKLKDHSTGIQKNIVDYDRSCLDKQIATYQQKKADWEQKILEKTQQRDALLEKLRERKEFFRSIKEKKELQEVILKQKKAEEEEKSRLILKTTERIA